VEEEIKGIATEHERWQVCCPSVWRVTPTHWEGMAALCAMLCTHSLALRQARKLELEAQLEAARQEKATYLAGA